MPVVIDEERFNLLVDEKVTKFQESYRRKYDYLLECFYQYKQLINEKNWKAEKEHKLELKALKSQIDELHYQAELKQEQYDNVEL